MISPMDRHIEMCIRHRRWFAGISQEQLAERIGVTSQQVQRYENGVHRVGAARLHDIAAVLDVSVDFFFAGLSPQRSSGAERDEGFGDTQALLDFYAGMPVSQRRHFIAFVQGLGRSADPLAWTNLTSAEQALRPADVKDEEFSHRASANSPERPK